jgi:hypothetical protein
MQGGQKNVALLSNLILRIRRRYVLSQAQEIRVLRPHYSKTKNMAVVERNWQMKLTTGNSLRQLRNLGQRGLEADGIIVQTRRNSGLKYCNRF